MRSTAGDVFLLIESVRLLRFQNEGFDLDAGEIVVSTGESYDDVDEVIYITRFGLGTLPDDDTFHNHESKKI